MIRFDKVIKRFGARTILNEISFTAKAGEILFILGTSGTGKSVLLKNIVGLLKPDAGHIWVDQDDIVTFSEEQFGPIRRKCGMVFQQPALFDSLTIFDNVAYGLRRHENLNGDELKARVLESLKLVNLKDITRKFPSEISYGMQKRVSLARTVALRPQILLFDEPTTGLDPITTNTVNHLIQDLSRQLKTTSLVVSHDMHCALEIADHILVLDKGSIIEEGTPQQLQASTQPLVRDFLAEVLTP